MSISNAPRKIERIVVIDAIKAISAQLIVLHHFCNYGPMTDAAWGYAPSIFKWFANDARLAVQCFLVMAGFLAAGAMLPAAGKIWTPPTMSQLPAIAFQRYMRLAKTFLVGLAAAIVCAAIARALVDDPTIPAAPTWIDLAANLVFAQDLLGIPALTAGAWYVAIDLQLYTMLALICAICAVGMRGARSAQSTRAVAMFAVVTLGLASLLVFNRHAEFEMWGIYFFGSYSLGMLAHWASRANGVRKWGWLATMALVCAFALVVQWRSRIAISTLTAFVLALRGAHRSTNSNWLAEAASFLSRISFPLFVLH
ncbi:MAG TPA: acyltransferase, partial [Burkholderiaceae bacterium]|nr:acyltransferase [Burkholderiaceae bacterium]